MVISEARLSSTLALAAIPVLLVLGAIIGELFGLSLSDGRYGRALGPAVYVVFFGGSAYAFYEFTKTLMGRARYITYRDGCIHILAHAPISLAQICSVAIERQFFLRYLAIKTSERTVRVRGYLLQRDLNEIKKAIELLQQSENS